MRTRKPEDPEKVRLRKQKSNEKKKDMGLVQVSEWIPKETKDQLKELAKQLREKK